MSSDPQLSEPDPGALARLALHVREFREYVEQLGGSLPTPEQTPFLHRQLAEQIEELTTALRKVGGEAHGDSKQKSKKGGLLGRMLGRQKNEAEPSESRADLEGNAWTVPISELMGFLATTGKTGVLCVNTHAENFVIEIRAGKLLRATSDKTPEGYRLGEILVRQGTLTEAEVPEIVEAAREGGTSLGVYLTQSGLVKEAELRAALATQIQGLFNRLMSSQNAIYRFRSGIDIEGATALELNVTSLLLEGARFHDERDRDARPPTPEVAADAETAASPEIVEAIESPSEPDDDWIEMVEAAAEAALAAVNEAKALGVDSVQTGETRSADEAA